MCYMKKKYIRLILMILNGEGWHHFAIIRLPALLRGTTSKYLGDFDKLKSNEKVYKNKDFSGIVLPTQKNNVLEFKQHMKSGKMSYIC